MTKDDITRIAREAGFVGFDGDNGSLRRFAALVAAAERNKVAQWMIDHSYATGHGDTTEDLLEELDWQITESWSKVVMASVEAEREACAKVAFNAKTYIEAAEAIRARGQDAP
jgi:hypothetical protein